MPEKSKSNLNSSLEKSTIKKRFYLSKSFLGIFAVLIAFVSFVFGVYYFYKYQELRKNPNIEAQREAKKLAEKVSELMELPEDEIPTVAVVTDVEKLKGQPFFAKAKNEDRLLLYVKSQIAILYRPSTNKIINVLPFVNNNISVNNNDINNKDSLQNVEEEQINKTPKIAYYNGAGISGLAAQTEELVKRSYPNYETAVLRNATKQDYTNILVVDITGKYKKEAEELAKLFNTEVSDLPEGEIKPDSDILIIVGN